MNPLQVVWRFYKLSCPRIKYLAGQQEIEQLLHQLEMLQKDAELERLHTVDEERRKWKTKETDLTGSWMQLGRN